MQARESSPGGLASDVARRAPKRRRVPWTWLGGIAAGGVVALGVWLFVPGKTRGAACATRERCQKDCARKDAASCLALGALDRTTVDGSIDLVAAASAFGAACDAGDAHGCLDEAYLYEDATTLDDKKAQAPELRQRAAAGFEAGCGAGDGYACLVLGELTIAGRGVTKSTAKATQLFAQARPLLEQQCAAKSAKACAALSIMVHRGLGGAKDPAHGTEVLAEACDLGDLASCRLAARTWADGPGEREAPQDAARAEAPFAKACALGDARGCHADARILAAAGKHPEALLLEQKACDAGDGDGCDALGTMMFSGEGTDANPKGAKALFEREVELRAAACARGSGGDCDELAQNYRSRAQGVKIDPAKAQELEDSAMKAWQAGCDAGLWTDCLAIRTRLEKEPMPDPKRIRALRERECSLGYEHSCRRLGIGFALARP
jgi:TPR repeat protein